VVGHFLQGIDCVGFCIDQKELRSEVQLKIGPGLDWKNAGVCFLSKEVFGPLCSSTSFEESECPEYLFFFTTKLL